jgi:Cofilin/tropomyosin-type actin-binding protein
VPTESVELQFSGLVILRDIRTVAKPGPCFIIHRGDETVFAFISPPATPIKHRMVYASFKQNLVHRVESLLGCTVKRVEADGADEIYGMVHVVEREEKVTFKKPARPGRN